MWDIAGTSELLASNAVDYVTTPLTATQKQKFISLVYLGSRLLSSRLIDTQLTKRGTTTAVKGVVFDPGASTDYYTYWYSGFNDISKMPTANDRTPTTWPNWNQIGWDIGHARRYVHVFNTLYKNKTVTGQTFPSRDVMIKLANQIAYKVYDGNPDWPRFTNLFDGTNGWYDVTLCKQKQVVNGVTIPGEGVGFAPYQSSGIMALGGYGFWGAFNEDINPVIEEIYSIYSSTTLSDADNKKRDDYYGSRWSYSSKTDNCSNTVVTFYNDQHDRRTILNMIQIIPTLNKIPVAISTPTSSPITTISSTINPTIVYPNKSKGDFNNDNKVDILDLSILASNWGTTNTVADANSDDLVGILDLSALASNWGKMI